MGNGLKKWSHKKEQCKADYYGGTKNRFTTIVCRGRGRRRGGGKPHFLQWENLRTPAKIHSEYTESDIQVFVLLGYGSRPHWNSKMQLMTFKQSQLIENLY